MPKSDWIDQYKSNCVGERGRDFANWAASKNYHCSIKGRNVEKNLLIFNRNVSYENAKQAIFARVYTSRVRLSGKWQLWNDHFKCERSNGSSPFDVHEIFYRFSFTRFLFLFKELIIRFLTYERTMIKLN